MALVILPDELSVPPRPRVGRRLRRALVVIGVGLLLVLACGARIAVHAVPAVMASSSAPELVTPVRTRLQLAATEYAVYQRTGQVVTGSADDVAAPATVQPDAVQVTRSGVRLAVRGPGTVSQTLTRDGDVYTAVAFFTVPVSGSYSVAVVSQEPTRLVVARSFGSAFTGMGPWFVGTLVGGGLLLLGTVLLVVGAMRGYDPRPLRTLPAPVGPAPPGWYGDPLRRGRTRWWDGEEWTDRTR